MQTPVEIDFQGMKAVPRIRDVIRSHVSALETRFGRLTTCRVVLKGPGRHHKTGGAYEFNIRLGVPSRREVNVSKTAKADERHSDLEFALNDAFKRVRRRLQDQVRRLQGQVRLHQGEPVGTVTKLDPSGFGFIETGDGREIYFHRNSVLNNAFSRLRIGTTVSFHEEPGEKGPQASTVKLVGRHGLRSPVLTRR
jgi:cold shock CspA family protein/ribosome-associated translation inhibitor RaiA